MKHVNISATKLINIHKAWLCGLKIAPHPLRARLVTVTSTCFGAVGCGDLESETLAL
jgi:hypothetical protein